MLMSRSLQFVSKGSIELPCILAAARTPLSTSASVYSTSSKESTASNSSPRDRRASQLSRASPESYQRARRGKFTQPIPQLHNPFIEDPFLRTCLSNMLPPQVTEDVFSDLERFGQRLCDEIDTLGRQVELEQPYLRTFDAWGNRVDDLVTSPAWKRLHDISAEEGLVALAYERKHHQWSRLHQMAKLFLFAPSSGLYSCPLAMTDGAAKLIEECGDEFIKNRAYSHLTARDPAHFWTSGQWMTEKQGGSDVADGTDTIAVGPPDSGDGSYRLHGYKWFTSATDAQMAFTLARLQHEDGMITEGTSGLSLFYLETKLPDGRFNNLEVQRLKDKLGTRQVPTAELLLDGTKAFMVCGSEGRGVANISPMLTITRLHNSISAVGAMRRILLLSRDYAMKRVAFRKYIADHPLHTQTLARMEVETRGGVLFVLDVARLLGLHDCGMASSSEQLLLRLLLPILKLYTAKQAIATVSEGLESFGGQGYMEDTGLPTFLRDAQVLPIWEGTTNILSLDVLRVLQKSGAEVLTSFVDAVRSRLLSDKRGLEAAGLSSQAEQVKVQLDTVSAFPLMAVQEDPSMMEYAARDFAFSLAQIYTGALLISHTLQVKDTPNIANWTTTAKRWCSRPLPLHSPEAYSQMEKSQDHFLVMDGYGLDRRSNDLGKLNNKF